MSTGSEMATKDLSGRCHRIHERSWWYEEPAGIRVYTESRGQVIPVGVIPWRHIRTALARTKPCVCPPPKTPYEPHLPECPRGQVELPATPGEPEPSKVEQMQKLVRDLKAQAPGGSGGEE